MSPKLTLLANSYPRRPYGSFWQEWTLDFRVAIVPGSAQQSYIYPAPYDAKTTAILVLVLPNLVRVLDEDFDQPVVAVNIVPQRAEMIVSRVLPIGDGIQTVV